MYNSGLKEEVTADVGESSYFGTDMEDVEKLAELLHVVNLNVDRNNDCRMQSNG